MNKYAELRNRQQKEFNALPLGFAFGDKQFEEMMKKWGLDPEKDLDKIYSVGYGGYIQKKDAELLHKTRERHDAEMEAAIEADKTGRNFIYQMFLYDLDNHRIRIYRRHRGHTWTRSATQRRKFSEIHASSAD